MNIALAKEVIRGAMQMNVTVRRQLIEPGKVVDDEGIEGIIAQVNAHIEARRGPGHSLEDIGYPLDWLPGLLLDAEVMSPARGHELVRIDLSQFIQETPEMKALLLAEAFGREQA